MNDGEPREPEGPVLLFDGMCNLCSGVVRFVLPRDRRGRFRFASLQSEAGRRLLRQAGLEPSEAGEDPDSLVLVEDGRAWTESSAALRTAAKLDGLWPALAVLLVVPRPLRDAVYRWVARNRYRWFGRRDAGWLPDEEDVRDRFLD